jgi:hypothetical protein
MRASLARRRPETTREALPLLQPQGARVILGSQVNAPVQPLSASRRSLFGPRGACLASSDGPLIVCDTGHHRLLVWTAAPRADGAPADLVIGQADFSSEGRNGKREIGPATFNVPTGVAAGGGVLAVADAWNNRVLLWHGLPRRSNQPADVVLGQADFCSGLANRGLGAPRADTLNWPYGVAVHEGRLYVADTGNRRVLAWHQLPETNGRSADGVLDQGMRWPHGIAAADDDLFVADAGLNRVLAWRKLAFHGVRGEGANMPYGVALHAGRVLVADTANSRLLGFEPAGGPARWLAAQATLSDTGDNRWGVAGRDSLCWPYGVAACGGTLAVADSGNNRVLLWDMA